MTHSFQPSQASVQAPDQASVQAPDLAYDKEPDQGYDLEPRDLSIYIPVVFAHVTEEFIKQKFDSIGIGSVSHVVFVHHVKNTYKRMAFIYFNNWYEKNWSDWLNQYQYSSALV